MIEKIRKLNNPMLLDLVVGNIFFLIIGEIIICIFLDVKCVIGYLIGVIAAIFMVIHMAFCIDDSVRMDEHTALKHTRKGYLFRIGILVALFFTVFFTGIGDPVAMVCGTLILKLSAYIQPITNRLTSKYLRKGR